MENKKPEKDLVITPKLASEYLASMLGNTPLLWLHRLANWRKPGRRAPLEAIKTEEGHPAYTWGAIDEFVAGQHASKVAISGLVVGDQPRAVAIAHLDGTESPHVRVSFAIGAVSQSVFAIDPATARKLAAMLTKSADVVAEASGNDDEEEINSGNQQGTFSKRAAA